MMLRMREIPFVLETKEFLDRQPIKLSKLDNETSFLQILLIDTMVRANEDIVRNYGRTSNAKEAILIRTTEKCKDI